MTQLSPSRAARSELLTADFMQRLDALDVMSHKILAGKMQGERRSKKKGQSVEFADYRVYVPGDDLRFIDWNLYARIEKLFLRLFVEEEDLTVSILVDVSKSMHYGDPDKLLFAKKLAAALGYIGLTHYNRLSFFAYNNQITEALPNQRGRRPVRLMLDFLANLQPAGAGNLAWVAKRFALMHRQKGVIIVISDFLDKGDLAESLRYLTGDSYDTYLIQTLAPQEIDPAKGNVLGDLRLVDLEDDDVAEVSVSTALLNRYKANLQAYCNHMRDQCLRRGATHLVSDTSVPFEHLVLKYLRQRGLVG